MADIKYLLEQKLGKDIDKSSQEEVFLGLLKLTKDMEKDRTRLDGNKKLYYISAEFLLGKLLSNNLINLGVYDEVEAILKEAGHSLKEIEELENEPSLGNGGLGRLAACYLDSIATLGLPGDGVGINYHFGLFKQVFKNRKQYEEKNPWITSVSWLNPTGDEFDIEFGKLTVKSILYDLDVVGYDNGVDKLHLFDIKTVDESIVKDGINFDKKDIAKNLTLFLYPDDSDKDGQLLRIYQQYFMVSSGAQLILQEMDNKGFDIRTLSDHVVIQINDTHPSMVIPELIRLLMKRGISIDEAIEIVSKTCAYTNHTILAEALEKWPISYLEEVVPQLLPIIEELNTRVVKMYGEKTAIIDKDKKVRMANMDIHYGISVNGVAALHTEILEKSELKDFYDIYPEKFNNKTNGITFRRWLMHCNTPLANIISSKIGDGWKKDADELKKLNNFIDDEEFLKDILHTKKRAKHELVDYVANTWNINLMPNSIFDIQIKRLHEYKRQQMNALYAIYKYLDIKAGNRPKTPITMIFAAKAAPAYVLAKDIIHLLLCLQELINKDEDVNPYLNLVILENYNVTLASKLVPACDVSEQISLASKEASGTGNMKFMLNGAVTLGTMDGANVEIAGLVGEGNIYIFGKDSETVINLYANNAYNPKELYDEDPDIRKWVDFITGEELLAIGDKVNLTRLHDNMVNNDYFMALLDVKDYIKVKEQAFEDGCDRMSWAKKMVKNIAEAGYFSADRAITEYNRDIWKL
ncbi:MAG: glycogen/starch/alpha-glucan family phosphorylase [Lachnospiraceae bacterium]|jgi:starch phosphorylase|nr:glycogen/starch/alpha-glucan family phosphorylase [Lachnospiraceae bacterium]